MSCCLSTTKMLAVAYMVVSASCQQRSHTIAPGVLSGRLGLHVGWSGDGARDSWTLRFAAQTKSLGRAGGRDWARHVGRGRCKLADSVGPWDALWGTCAYSGEACRIRSGEGRRKDAHEAQGTSAQHELEFEATGVVGCGYGRDGVEMFADDHLRRGRDAWRSVPKFQSPRSRDTRRHAIL
jgi:hypothetical protein